MDIRLCTWLDSETGLTDSVSWKTVSVLPFEVMTYIGVKRETTVQQNGK